MNTDNSKKILNLEKSYIYYYGKKNSIRINIKSFLYDGNNKFYLTKECRAEAAPNEQPFFNHSGRYEWLSIVKNNEWIEFRSQPVEFNIIQSENQKNHQSNLKWKIEKKLLNEDYELLSFEKTFELVSNEKDNIYIQIEFEYENKIYKLISKCEYMNFGKNLSNEEYLQPIMGYVPFIYKEKIFCAYVALIMTKKKSGHLEFILNEKTDLLFSYNDNKIKKFIKTIYTFFFPFLKKNNFTKVISIKKSNYFFFRYLK